MLRTLLGRVRGSQCSALSAEHCLHALDGVCVVGSLVVPIATHTGKAEGDPTGIARGDLDTVERDLDDLLWLDVDDVAVAPRAFAELEREEPLGLPAQQLVGESLERLADHHPLAVGATRREVQIGEPALAATVTPLDGDDDEVECVDRFDLAPRAASPACVVWRVEVLH